MVSVAGMKRRLWWGSLKQNKIKREGEIVNSLNKSFALDILGCLGFSLLSGVTLVSGFAGIVITLALLINSPAILGNFT